MSVSVSLKTVEKVRMIIGKKPSSEDVIEFIVFNGIYEDDFRSWDLIPELWNDWLCK